MFVLRGGQVNPEMASRFSIGFHPDPSSHSLYGLSHNGEPNSCPFVLPPWMNLLKHSEDAFLKFGLDSNSLIFNPKPHVRPAAFGPNTDLRFHSLRHKFYRILHKVGDDLRQKGVVRDYIEKGLSTVTLALVE